METFRLYDEAFANNISQTYQQSLSMVGPTGAPGLRGLQGPPGNSSTSNLYRGIYSLTATGPPDGSSSYCLVHNVYEVNAPAINHEVNKVILPVGLLKINYSFLTNMNTQTSNFCTVYFANDDKTNVIYESVSQQSGTSNSPMTINYTFLLNVTTEIQQTIWCINFASIPWTDPNGNALSDISRGFLDIEQIQ